VSLAGFAYPLDHALVQRGSTRLLSNVVSSAIQHVDVHQGLVFMIAWKHQIEHS
jgi:thiamine pyrophosphokinase